MVRAVVYHSPALYCIDTECCQSVKVTDRIDDVDGPIWLSQMATCESKEMKRAQELKGSKMNKAGHTATPFAFGWAGAVIEKVTGAFGQRQ